MKHSWSFCTHCDHDVVICGKCGNNTCNGGYGTTNGKDCDACPSAYDLYLNGAYDLYLKREQPKQTQCSICKQWMFPWQICEDTDHCEYHNEDV